MVLAGAFSALGAGTAIFMPAAEGARGKASPSTRYWWQEDSEKSAEAIFGRPLVTLGRVGHF